MRLVNTIQAVTLTGGLLAFAAVASVTAEAGKTTAPSTAAEHFAMAKKYDAKAAEYKAEAEDHHQMLAQYTQRNSVPNLESKLGRDPWIDRMKAHCEKYIASAESLSAEAKAFADYHRMRGKELEGK